MGIKIVMRRMMTQMYELLVACLGCGINFMYPNFTSKSRKGFEFSFQVFRRYALRGSEGVQRGICIHYAILSSNSRLLKQKEETFQLLSLTRTRTSSVFAIPLSLASR